MQQYNAWAYANIPSNVSADGKAKTKTAGAHEISCKDFDMCKRVLQTSADCRCKVCTCLCAIPVPLLPHPPLLGLTGHYFPELDLYGAVLHIRMTDDSCSIFQI